MKGKRGYFFSLDAFIALLIILAVVLVIKPTVKQTAPEIHIQEDLIKTLSSIKIGEIDNSYVLQLISEGKINDLNQSVLEQIGEFYASSDPEAELLAQNILSSLDSDYNIGIYFNGITIAENADLDFGNAQDVWTSRQIISGIQSGNSVKGYSSRAFLSSSDKVEYIYFGGYVGDGNISIRVEDDINDIDIEAVFSGPFDIYINGNIMESYIPEVGVPLKIDLVDSIGEFNLGINEISFVGENGLYIAGGFIKVKHDTISELSSSYRKYFPGIDGLINIYDGIYIPGELNSLGVYLHYNSNYNIFMNVGNTTIYSGNTSGFDSSITLSDAQISSLLDYDSMGFETIPFRIGLENASYIFNQTLEADVFSVTDLSGSMQETCSGSSWWCCFISGGCDTESECSSCGGVLESKIEGAKDANKVFIDSVLNNSDHRVGLVGYAGSVLESNTHALSNDDVSLKAEVDSWVEGGTTCICCGINNAVSKLNSQSNSEKFRSLVVMSDGVANVRCSQQGTGNAKQDAINAACEAYDNYGIRVYSVGFGSDVDEPTLQSISSCGKGSYYYGDVDDLVDVYGEIAEEIRAAAYVEQTVVGENVETQLFSDSYIYIDYEKEIPYGLVISAETPEFGNTISEGSFNLPNDTEIYEVKVTSYSGSRWTDVVDVQNESDVSWNRIFSLEDYGLDYVDLGDPYIVNIPIEYIGYGNNNVRVSTALRPENSTGGSDYDKIIYTLVKEISGYSPIVSSAEGCTWFLEFEDSSNATIKIPTDYNGSKECYFTSDNLAYNNNDAIDLAIFRLLSSLDLDSNRKIETKFSENDLTLSSTEVEGIPFTWDTEVQVRVWR